MFLRRCGLESRPVVPKHDRSGLGFRTWMSVLLTPMSVKFKTASKIRCDPAGADPLLPPNVRQLRKETEDFRSRLNTHLEANELKKETEEAEGMKQIIVVSHPAFDHVASAVPSLSDMLLPA